MNISGCVAPSIVDGDGIFWISLIKVGSACKPREVHLFFPTLCSPDCHFSKKIELIDFNNVKCIMAQ